MANKIKSPAEILEAAGNAIETAVDKAGDGVEALAGKASDAKERIDKARFGPVFDLDQIADNMPQVIFVEDNQRLKSVPACKGAFGFIEKLKGMQVMRLLPKYIGLPGIKFYPDTDGVLYFQDPCDDHLYIDINDYFDYLNAVRVNELELIAQDLGAKHVKVVYRETRKIFVDNDAKADDPDEYSFTEVFTDDVYDAGDAPTAPALQYLANDPSISSLIERRLDSGLDSEQSIDKEAYTIPCKTLDGMSVDDAMRIDAIIKTLKLKGNASVASAAEALERAVLEYSIEF